MPIANLYLNQLGIDTSYSYQLSYDYRDSLSVRKFAINTYKLQYKTSASPVQLRMYNNEGEFIYGWSQCFGSLKRFGILDSVPLKQVSHLPVNMNLSFQNDINLFNISPLEKEELHTAIEETDYVIVILWAMWAGWYSKDVLKSVNKYVEKNNETKFLVIKLNVAQGYPE